MLLFGTGDQEHPKATNINRLYAVRIEFADYSYRNKSGRCDC
jgi:hypothetical protein